MGGAGGWFKPSNKTAGFLIVFLIHLAIIQIADAVLAMAKCKIVLFFLCKENALLLLLLLWEKNCLFSYSNRFRIGNNTEEHMNRNIKILILLEVNRFFYLIV